LIGIDFGPSRAMRRAVFDHLLWIGAVLMLLTVIAYTIDLASHFTTIRAEAASRDAPLLTLLAPYLGQRGIDILVRMLPTATFFGIFLVEIRRRHRLESVILQAAGASPWRSYLPLISAGLLIGAVFWTLEAVLRPPAIWAQVESGLGGYAERFPIGWNREEWFVAGDIALRADLYRSETPYLANVLVFDGLRQDALSAILSADIARPENGQWALSGVQVFDPDTGAAAPAPDLTVASARRPTRLRYHGFGELLRPISARRALQGMEPRPPNAAWADVGLLRRATAWMYPALIAVVAAALVPYGYEGRQARTGLLVAFGAAGYIYVTAMKVIGRLGALDVLNPMLAVLAPLGASALVALILIRARP